MSFKICSKCKESLPATAEYFNRDKNRKDGLGYYCKKCKTNDTKKWAKKNSGRVKNNNKKFREKNPDYMKKYYEKNKYKIKKINKKCWEKHQKKYKETAEKWRKENPEKIKNYRKKHYEKNKDKIKIDFFKKKCEKYGLTVEQAGIILIVEQDMRCPICMKKFKDIYTSAELDHDHNLGNNGFRGFLCKSCNLKLGWYENNIFSIKKYLKENEDYSHKNGQNGKYLKD